MAGVSGGIGATNACTWMYRLAFIADPDMGDILAKKGLVRGGAFGYFSRCREK